MNNKLIYTSYDGDNIPLIDSFIKLVIDFKYVPINPTKSLGYYISTSIHDNDKGECLKDCLSLEMICDELWVFIDNNKYIPEGVRLEISTWLKYKSSPVKYISIPSLLENSSINDDLFLDFDDSNILKEKEISELVPKKSELRPVNCINILPEHHKYIDWIKYHLFYNKFVPLDYLSIKPYIYFDNIEHYKSELSLLNERCNYISVMPYYVSENNFNLSFSECKIPKYIKKDWAITTMENKN